MAKKTNNDQGCCVLTLPLYPEPWQEHIIETRFKIMEHLKNSLIALELRKYKNVCRTKALRELEEEIAKATSQNERNALINKKRKFLKDNGLHDYAFIDDITPMQKHFKEHFAAQIVQKTASDVWQAFDKFLFSSGRKVHFIERGQLASIACKEVGNGMNYRNGFFEWNGGKTSNKISLKIRVAEPDTDYERLMLKKPMRYLRIVRKWMKTRFKYYLQITLAGPPIPKERPIAQGRVGIDIGPRTAAIATADRVELVELANRIEDNHIRKCELQRKMDSSRRCTNPDLFIKGSAEVKHRRLIKSKNYMRLQGKVRELERKNAAIRKYQHTCLANHILSLGTEVFVENMNFSGLQHRAKETEKTASGRFKKKKRFGKSLAQKAPSMFLTILKNKLKSTPGGQYHEVVTTSFKASQYDHTDGSYRKKLLKERWARLSNGDSVQRDLYSAFLLMNSREDLYAADQTLCEETYARFKAQHDREIQNLYNSKQQYPSSFGLTGANPEPA